MDYIVGIFPHGSIEKIRTQEKSYYSRTCGSKYAMDPKKILYKLGTNNRSKVFFFFFRSIHFSEKNYRTL